MAWQNDGAAEAMGKFAQDRGVKRAPGIPGLLGLRADYISAQLGAWRYGTRTAIAPDCMQYVASNLTEPQVAAVSTWLAAQPLTAVARPAKTPASDMALAHLPLACGSQR